MLNILLISFLALMTLRAMADRAWSIDLRQATDALQSFILAVLAVLLIFGVA